VCLQLREHVAALEVPPAPAHVDDPVSVPGDDDSARLISQSSSPKNPSTPSKKADRPSVFAAAYSPGVNLSKALPCECGVRLMAKDGATSRAPANVTLKDGKVADAATLKIGTELKGGFSLEGCGATLKRSTGTWKCLDPRRESTQVPSLP